MEPLLSFIIGYASSTSTGSSSSSSSSSSPAARELSQLQGLPDRELQSSSGKQVTD